MTLQANKTSFCRQIDTITFDDKELTGIAGTAKGICKAKEPEDMEKTDWYFLIFQIDSTAVYTILLIGLFSY